MLKSVCVCACAYDTSCVCDLLLCECSSKYKSDKSCFLWCLVFLTKWIHKGVSDSMMSSLRFSEREADAQTAEIMCSWKESKVSNKNIKRLNSFLTLELAMRGNRKQNGLSCITILRQNIFCLFWSAKHICRFVCLPQTNQHHNRTEHGSVLWFSNQPSES